MCLLNNMVLNKKYFLSANYSIENYFIYEYTQSMQLSTKKMFFFNYLWCRWPESNRHSFRHCPLKTACLPIPPHRLILPVINFLNLTNSMTACYLLKFPSHHLLELSSIHHYLTLLSRHSQ